MHRQEILNYRKFLAPEEPFDMAKWRTGILESCKWFSKPFWKHWLFLYEQVGYVKANLWLAHIKERIKLGGTGLFIDAYDSEIMSYSIVKAKSIALDTLDFGRRFDKYTALSTIKSLFERTGLTFPLEEKYLHESYDRKKVVAALARIQDPHWLAKQLRNKASRELEQIAREIGLVQKFKAPYLSEFTLKRAFMRQNANRKLLEKLIATNDLGQHYTLAELSDLGVSNPLIRRNELMTRLSGYEAWAENDKQEWISMFYTITTPSKFHVMTSVGKKPIPNPKYNGSTPKEAQGYLNTLWQRARSELNRQEIEHFGFRVAEPHHDGTPHWHILLFVLKGQENTLTEVLRHYVLQEDGDEPGAQKYRFEAVEIDPKKGRATGYIAKYISKNIDGYKVGLDDESGESATISSIRAACWASIWGIRQFQQIGGTPVTVWRECRRGNVESIEDKDISEILEAADEGNWEEFVEKMGGATVKRKDLPLRANYFVKLSSGKYGDDTKKLIGLFSSSGETINTQPRTWTISLKRKEVVPHNQAMSTGPPRGPLEYCQ